MITRGRAIKCKHYCNNVDITLALPDIVMQQMQHGTIWGPAKAMLSHVPLSSTGSTWKNRSIRRKTLLKLWIPRWNIHFLLWYGTRKDCIPLPTHVLHMPINAILCPTHVLHMPINAILCPCRALAVPLPCPCRAVQVKYYMYYND